MKALMNFNIIRSYNKYLMKRKMKNKKHKKIQ